MHYGEFANYTEHFAQALQSGTSYSPNLIEGLETYAIMEATREAARTNKPVQLQPLLARIGIGATT